MYNCLNIKLLKVITRVHTALDYVTFQSNANQFFEAGRFLYEHHLTYRSSYALDEVCLTYWTNIFKSINRSLDNIILLDSSLRIHASDCAHTKHKTLLFIDRQKCFVCEQAEQFFFCVTKLVLQHYVLTTYTVRLLWWEYSRHCFLPSNCRFVLFYAVLFVFISNFIRIKPLKRKTVVCRCVELDPISWYLRF